MLADILDEAPYRVPDHGSFGGISALVNAKHSAAQDRLWSLREDPAYFKTHVFEQGEHRLERLHDSRGQPHYSLQGHSNHELGSQPFWDRVLENALIIANKNVWTWKVLTTQINMLPPNREDCQLRSDGPNM